MCKQVNTASKKHAGILEKWFLFSYLRSVSIRFLTFTILFTVHVPYTIEIKRLCAPVLDYKECLLERYRDGC